MLLFISSKVKSALIDLESSNCIRELSDSMRELSKEHGSLPRHIARALTVL